MSRWTEVARRYTPPCDGHFSWERGTTTAYLTVKTLRDDLTSYIVFAECPVDGFYAGSFTWWGGKVAAPGADLVEIGVELTQRAVDELSAQLRWAGVRPEWMQRCLAGIEWSVDIKPAVIRIETDGCERCGHDYIDHDFTPFGQPRGCDEPDCDCPEWIEPEENE